MPMTGRTQTGAVALMALMTTNAFAATAGGERSTDNVSGYAGKSVNVIQFDDGKSGVAALHFWEDHDKPCWVKAESRHLDDQRQAGTPEDIIVSNCGGARTMGDKSISSRDFVYKLQVCTTDRRETSKNRVKGVRIYRASVDAGSGAVTQSTNYSGFERPNCNGNWRPAVECKNGIATGLDLHFNSMSLTGIGLRCSPVSGS